MSVGLEAQLKKVGQEESEILGKIDERSKRKRIDCLGCGKSHQIQNLTLIQTHYYISPYGCTEGDYWNEGEMQFVCPETEVINRLFFTNSDVPWEERKKYENNPEEQFKRMYGPLFRRFAKIYDERIPGKWKNNYYVDKNRKKFGLVEKK